MAQGRTREISSEDMVAAIGESLTLVEAADLIGCSGASISNRMREDVEVRSAALAQTERRENRLAVAIMNHRGILSEVAKEVGLGSAQAVRYHIVRSPALREVFEESRGKVIDKAEGNVFDAVDRGNLQYSKFILTTLGKERGYVEKKEVDKQVTHKVDQQSTGNLIAMLNDMAVMSPDVIEAEFEDMPEEDREVLAKALSAHSSEEAAEREAGEDHSVSLIEPSVEVSEAAG
jgi:hypothetical protein